MTPHFQRGGKSERSMVVVCNPLNVTYTWNIAHQWAIGVGSPSGAAKSRNDRVGGFFLALRKPSSMAGRAEGAVRLAGAPSVFQPSFRSASHSGIPGRAGRGSAGNGEPGSGIGRAGQAWAGSGMAWSFLVGRREAMEAKAVEVFDPTNGGKASIEAGIPYRVSVQLTGSSDLLFHRWNCEAVDSKTKAAKNSNAKKTDNVESYLYRDNDDCIAIPGEYVRQSIIAAAKFRQDPRSPRKSAMDLYKAGVVSLTQLASTGKKDPDYLDTRRVVIQRSGVNRTRPALRAGWKSAFLLMVLTPEYINATDLHAVLTQAGTLVGIGDFRPTYGRFGITSFEVLAS